MTAGTNYVEDIECMAGTTGLEPATSAVTGQRSNQLSYVPTGSGFTQAETVPEGLYALHGPGCAFRQTLIGALRPRGCGRARLSPPHFMSVSDDRRRRKSPNHCYPKSAFLFSRKLEARAGIEPAHKGFADLSLTTWVPRLGRACSLFWDSIHFAVANPAGTGGQNGAGDEI